MSTKDKKDAKHRPAPAQLHNIRANKSASPEPDLARITRIKTAASGKKRTPSMPKMPWDDK